MFYTLTDTKAKSNLRRACYYLILQMRNLGNREVNCLLKVTQTKPASILEPISLDFLPTVLSATL